MTSSKGMLMRSPSLCECKFILSLWRIHFTAFQISHGSRELSRLCRDKAAELFTYTYSTSVRAAMLAAGFYVAKGRGTGRKVETTICLSPRAAAQPHGHQLLGAEWLDKWRRSDAQTPCGSLADEASWHDAVIQHPQFVRRL